MPTDGSPWVDHITWLRTVTQVVSFEEPAAPLWGAKAKPRAMHVDIYFYRRPKIAVGPRYRQGGLRHGRFSKF